jgi:hypothetical protein
VRAMEQGDRELLELLFDAPEPGRRKC